MDVCGDIILGLNQPPDAWRGMVKFAIDLKLDFVSFNVYNPVLGSIERRKKIERGELKPGEWGFDSTAWKKTLIENAGNRSMCVRAFYNRPSYLIKRLFKLRSFEELSMKLEEFLTLFAPWQH